MKLVSLGAIGLALAGLVFAATEPIVPISALKVVEEAANKQFEPQDGADSWEPLGDARGTYLPGYGAVFTFEMCLVNVPPLTPFHLTVSAQEVKSIHDRKINKLPVLKSAMRDLIVKAASSLTTLPPNEQITFEAWLDNYTFEDRQGLPRRITMTATRQKLLDAIARHATPAEIAPLIGVQEE